MSTVSPFDAVADAYDDTFSNSAIGILQRTRVRTFLQAFLKAKSGKILELNCGTGVDAVWLANQGFSVVATDISAQMVAVTAQKIAKSESRIQASALVCDMNNLKSLSLSDVGMVFSNFGGLNCLSASELSDLDQNLQDIIKPQGCFVAVVMGRYCWWETLYFSVKGNWKSAFRRYQKTPVSAVLDAHTTVDTWYYSPSEFNQFFPTFKVEALYPIGFWIPPSYLEPFFNRRPRLLKALYFLERWSNFKLLASASDHYMVVLRKD